MFVYGACICTNAFPFSAYTVYYYGRTATNTRYDMHRYTNGALRVAIIGLKRHLFYRNKIDFTHIGYMLRSSIKAM